jgi:PadR family transcriptional regulator, regulatory protein PadR
LDSPSLTVRGSLDLFILAAIARGDAHGYAIAASLKGLGLGDVKGGTLYPALARLEAGGLVVPRWEVGGAGPARKRYALTASGWTTLKDRAAAWRAQVDGAGRLLDEAVAAGAA